MRYVLVAKAEVANGAFGWAWVSEYIAVIFDGAVKKSDDQREDTAAHEIGHTFGLRPRRGVADRFDHIDNRLYIPGTPGSIPLPQERRSHCNQDGSLMSYDRDREDSIVEFCIPCLLIGSADGSNDSLRDQDDR